jgi:hypothetical protein
MAKLIFILLLLINVTLALHDSFLVENTERGISACISARIPSLEVASPTTMSSSAMHLATSCCATSRSSISAAARSGRAMAWAADCVGHAGQVLEGWYGEYKNIEVQNMSRLVSCQIFLHLSD